MNDRGTRLVLLLMASFLGVSTWWKGHGAPCRQGPVAFVRYTGTGVTVRLAGEVAVSGIYRFCDGVTLQTVINMTAPQVAGKLSDITSLRTPLRDGDIVTVMGGEGQLSEISIKRMKARELILLCLPLHPDAMDFDDWDSLPGIGPGLARAILDDRQENGDFGTVKGLLRVSGFGEGKLREIERYFASQ